MMNFKISLDLTLLPVSGTHGLLHALFDWLSGILNELDWLIVTVSGRDTQILTSLQYKTKHFSTGISQRIAVILH